MKIMKTIEELALALEERALEIEIDFFGGLWVVTVWPDDEVGMTCTGESEILEEAISRAINHWDNDVCPDCGDKIKDHHLEHVRTAQPRAVDLN
jgi:hypothetical protein